MDDNRKIPRLIVLLFAKKKNLIPCVTMWRKVDKNNNLVNLMIKMTSKELLENLSVLSVPLNVCKSITEVDVMNYD